MSAIKTLKDTQLFHVARLLLLWAGVGVWAPLVGALSASQPAAQAPQGPLLAFAQPSGWLFLNDAAQVQVWARFCPPSGPIRAGQRVWVVGSWPRCVLASEDWPPSWAKRLGAPVEINRQGLEHLRRLPGVGPKRAQALAAARPFTGPDDLRRVRGFGPKRVRALRGWVRFEPAPVLVPGGAGGALAERGAGLGALAALPAQASWVAVLPTQAPRVAALVERDAHRPSIDPHPD